MKALIPVAMIVTFVIVSFGPAAPVQAQSEDVDAECDPYPIGRCGAYQREQVVFCWVMRDGQHASATDHRAVAFVSKVEHLEVEVGVNEVDNSLLYARTEPSETFLEDPNSAPFPFRTLYQESNYVPGLQPEPFECGKWTWFAECVPQQWMGPTGEVKKAPDSLLV